MAIYNFAVLLLCPSFFPTYEIFDHVDPHPSYENFDDWKSYVSQETCCQ